MQIDWSELSKYIYNRTELESFAATKQGFVLEIYS